MRVRRVEVALTALGMALAFYTVLPSPATATSTEGNLKRAFLAVPFVGLVVGLLLVASQALLSLAPSAVRGACLGVLWLVLTGALHFDGLCDTADAAFAATTRAERVRIASDPHLGSFALATGASILLLKVAALTHPIPGVALAAIPVLARTGVLFVAALFPSHAASRLGAAARPSIPNATLAAGASALVVLVALTLAGMPLAGMVMIAATFLLAVGMAGLLSRRLGGLGGDAYGGIIETLEAALLLLATGLR